MLIWCVFFPAALPNKVAVDFYGPTHFVWGTPQPTGPVSGLSQASYVSPHDPAQQTLFRERQLRALGWHVHTVTFWDWAAVVHSEQEQTAHVDAFVAGTPAA